MKAERCLQDHGRELDYPLFDRRQPRTRRTVQEIQACNLISGIMKVPVAPEQYRHTNRSGTWTEAQIGRHHFSGLVYSLDVTPHHKYVANGIVTCNSIYAFRGGDLNGMMWLAKRETTEVIKLEQNFRSHEEICQAAQNLIEHNRERIEKQTVSAKGPGGQVTRRHSALNEGEELAIVANAIKEQPTMDIAVLCRTNAMAYYFHQGLAAAGLPVVTRERSTMPKDWAMTRAFVEFAANPQNDTLAHFYIIARNTNAGATPASAKQSAHESLRMARANGKSLNAAVLHMIQPDTAAEVLGAAKLYAISKESYMLLTEIVHTQVGPEASPIELALALGNRREHVREDKDQTGIHCITIHAAKGREFDAVFLAGWEQEIIPGHRTDELEESRRLAYVAITRARNFVMVTDCQTRQTPWGTIAAHCPSQFIGEMSR
jgi:DNA helicase-2/ATP-dependent DNA helicase PcrA